MIKEIALRKLANTSNMGSYLNYKNGEVDGKIYGGGIGGLGGAAAGGLAGMRLFKNKKLGLIGAGLGALAGSAVGSGVGGKIGGLVGWARGGDKPTATLLPKQASMDEIPDYYGLEDGLRARRDVLMGKINAGKSFNPALEGYTAKKNLVKKLRKNPSLLNKLKVKVFI